MDRVVDLREAVAELVNDGDSVALEGFTHLIPTAAAHEVIRQRKKGLTLIRMTPGLIYDQMIGMGCSAKEVIIMLRHKPRAFVEELGFVTSVGHGSGGNSREELGYTGAGPAVVITDLGVLRPDPESRELTLVALHPGATVEQALDSTG